MKGGLGCLSLRRSERLLASLLVKGADALLPHHLLRHELFVFVGHLGSLFVVLVQDPL